MALLPTRESQDLRDEGYSYNLLDTYVMPLVARLACHREFWDRGKECDPDGRGR